MSRSSPGLPTSPKPLQQFNAEIQILLKASNAESRSMLGYIDRLLKQFNLDGRFSVIDIFVIAYLRGVEQLLNPEGKPIRKPKAWMKGTILNIIRERQRSLRREFPLLWEIMATPSEQLVFDSAMEDSFAAVAQAFSRLSEQDRKIIELHKLRGMLWKDVLKELGEPYLTLAALRKRGQRALENLRMEYHKIKPPIDRDDS